MKIYLDYAAATPYVWQAWLKAVKYNWLDFGNPLSMHEYGRRAQVAITKSRAVVAGQINSLPDELFFVASGTESINLALMGTASANWGRGKHIITTAIEHHAVLHALEHLESQGFEVTYLPVNEQGFVTADEVKKYLRPETILVTVMLGNNETGALQPVKEIAKMVKEYNANCLVHTDACQAGNWLDINVQELGVDLLSLDSSKVYGPKGVGTLYVKTGTAVNPIIFGGTQENNLRAGTHNVAGIVGFAAALEIAAKRRSQDVTKTEVLKKQLIAELAKLNGVILNSQNNESLPHIVNFSVLNKSAAEMVAWFDQRGVCLSAGAACTTGSLKPSHVILAQTGSIDQAQSAVRVSFGRTTSARELVKFMTLLKTYIKMTE